MSSLTSQLCDGHTSHTRFSPIKRTFKYNLSYLLVHLNTSKKLNNITGFHWNSKRFFSLHDDTYLIPNQGTVYEKACHFIHANAPQVNYKHVYLLTCPRFFNLNFNPVSFFYYLDKAQKIKAVIAEVHNTFKEKHIYLLTDPVIKGDHLYFENKKELHVSPFYKTEGKYCFLFSKNICNINVTINYFKEDKKMFNAHLKLTSTDLNSFSFLKMSHQLISTALKTFPRILFQASILKFKHRLPIFRKSKLNSSFSFSRKPPSFLSKVFMSAVFNTFNMIQNGKLTVNLPDGQKKVFGNSKDNKIAEINIVDYSFFNYLVLKSDIGFADSFILGYWNSPCLESVFEIMVNNHKYLNYSNPISKINRLILRIKHGLNRNSLVRAKKNIFEHYDLGNDFFKLFLDENRVYSSAVYDTPQQPLAEAQINKINHVLDLADIEPNHKILEIGSGWGALAIHAAQNFGCHVTTVTISEEQYNFVKKKINKLHLDNKIEVKLMDYRLLNGKYDRIVSVEMLEAVGPQYYDTFFKKCNDLLHRGGKAVFQCIMIPESRYENYLKNPDFIQKYIFPGGHLPTLELIEDVVKRNRFDWINTYPITSHYVPTLNAWDQSFVDNKNKIEALGFDDAFFNTWRYYFNYCSAGFKTDHIQNHQFLIQKCLS
ncbi:MAG: DUF1365 family protein [Candidatus Margulisiibacteriota bacterium]